MSIGTKVIELGKISGDSPLSVAVQIKNIGNAGLILSNVASICGSGGIVEIADFPKTIVMLHKAGTVRVTFNPSGIQGETLKGFAIMSNDPAHSVLILSIHAVVVISQKESDEKEPVLAPPILIGIPAEPVQ